MTGEWEVQFLGHQPKLSQKDFFEIAGKIHDHIERGIPGWERAGKDIPAKDIGKGLKMLPDNALERLDAMQEQIIQGPKIFHEIGDVIRRLTGKDEVLKKPADFGQVRAKGDPIEEDEEVLSKTAGRVVRSWDDASSILGHGPENKVSEGYVKCTACDGTGYMGPDTKNPYPCCRCDGDGEVEKKE